ncbi:MAG: HlyD family efflux transporter periplasmic adaptor subunit [Woeseiaceae bacterium]|jgi:HlyD family secretion protein|nr:HlyD family efflux transporter periplasmic adaptor subunit [Woeseiaceae bacterium]
MKIADTSAQDVKLAPKGNRTRNLVGGGSILAVLVVLWVAIPALNRWSSTSASIPYDRLRIAEVIRADLVRDVSVQGRVVAAVSPTLYAPAAGTLSLLVEAGASVEEDQVLAIVDSPELENQLKQAEASLEEQEMELERQRIESKQAALEKRKGADLADVALVAAKREMRRAEEAHKRGVIPVIDFEKAKDDLRNAELAYGYAVADADLFDERLKFELRAKELSRNRQQLFVTELQRQVEQLDIRSPVAGIVGDLLVEQRAAVSRDTPVMAVVDLSRFEIDAQIPESYADDLAIGMQAEIILGDRKYSGQLVAVSPEIVANQVRSRIRFSGDMPPNIRQNQRLTTRVLLEERPSVLTLQRGQFLETGGGRIAYVLREDDIAERRQISIGGRSLSSVEIISGLSEGDRVIISSIDQFRSAETVLITD